MTRSGWQDVSCQVGRAAPNRDVLYHTKLVAAAVSVCDLPQEMLQERNFALFGQSLRHPAFKWYTLTFVGESLTKEPDFCAVSNRRYCWHPLK